MLRARQQEALSPSQQGGCEREPGASKAAGGLPAKTRRWDPQWRQRMVVGARGEGYGRGQQAWMRKLWRQRTLAQRRRCCFCVQRSVATNQAKSMTASLHLKRHLTPLQEQSRELQLWGKRRLFRVLLLQQARSRHPTIEAPQLG